LLSIPPFVIGLTAILFRPSGARSLISFIIVPFSSNNSSGLYDFNHFSKSAIFSILNAETGIGTW